MNFLREFLQTYNKNYYPLSHIINFDETLLPRNLISNTSIAKKGVKRV